MTAGFSASISDMVLAAQEKPRRRNDLRTKRHCRSVAAFERTPILRRVASSSGATLVDRPAALPGSIAQRETTAGTIRIGTPTRKRATLKARALVSRGVEGSAQGNVTRVRARAGAV
jgi:hypothetical protein